jgi:Pregnancy-associated plasma protein-A/Secretion system C-terminal sorting domain
MQIRMNKLLLTIIAFFTIVFGFAQNAEPIESNPLNRCATDDIIEQIYKLRPEMLERQKQSERNYLQSVAKSSQTSWRSALIVTIPVVVHVMHLPGTPVGTNENITTAQIEAGIQHLTQAFRKQTADFNGTGRNVNIVGVDVELEFCLAKQDPSGNATNGINRVATPLSDLDITTTVNQFTMKDLSRWDTERYLNIWLVREICKGINCGTAGFAYYSDSHGQPWDGVVNEARFFGSSPTGSKIHIHEVGHYFNLAHTFGDATTPVCTNNNCLTDGDRVCDTPPDVSTAGVACGASDNSCTNDADDTDVRNPFRSTMLGGLGDQGDLYEDYMDYSPQSCQKIYTEGQKTRMRAALDGDRKLLKTSLGCVSPTTAALAYFGDGGGSTSESAATTAIDCRKYVDVNVPIKLFNTSASPVTVNLSVGTGSASNNADFQLMTPSVLIAAGATTGNATLRIFNDKAVESTKNVVLNIGSATAGVAPFNNSFNYGILDDDVAPSGARPILYSSDFTGISDWTISAFNAFSSNVFTSGANGGTCTSGNSLYVTNNTTTKPNTYNNVSGWPLIYRTFNAAGYTGLQVKFDYKVGGDASANAQLVSRNPIGTGSFNFLSFSPNYNVACSQNFTSSLPASFNNSNFELGFSFRTVSTAPVTNPSFTVDNFEISANATPISSNLTSISEYLGPNSTVNFSTATGELLATIENPSNHDYGCTTVEIDRTGNTTTSNAGKTFMTKTFKVTPTTNLATGSHRTTLYYTGVEVSAWTTATGAGVSAMGLFKSTGAIASTTSITDGTSKSATPFGTSTAFSATFNTGFSGFGVANNTVLAVDLLTFEGIKGNKNVKLRWKTASEKNNDYFIIEKSRDGQVFEAMTKITSQGASSDILNYETLDNAPVAGMNYYRLKSVDRGGQIATSKVVSVVFVEKIKLTVYPNPTTVSKINVELTSDRDERIDFEVVDIVGRTVHTMSQNVTNGLNTIAFDNLTVSKGIYFIRAKQNNIVTAIVRFVRL